MTGHADAVNLEIAAAMPWLRAAEESIWEISGTYPDGGTFENCLASVLPAYVTGGPVVFVFMGASGLISPWNAPITPDRISSACELILVDANHPREAYYVRDQPTIDRAS